MSEQPRRVNYSVGMLLTASDSEAEQGYHRQMRYLHNRLLHGYGTVAGLDVSVDDDAIVHVSPGVAIDALGREIIVTKRVSLRLDPLGSERQWVRDLAIAWREVPEDPTLSLDGPVTFSRWIEEPELSLVLPDGPTSGKLILARLTRKRRRGAIDVDATVRRPLGTPSEIPCTE